SSDDGHARETPVPGNRPELGLPVPVGGLDLMVQVPAEDGQPEGPRAPVTMFVAPGGGALAGAVDIGPAPCRGEHGPAQGPAEAIPEPREVGRAKTPPTDEPVAVYGQAAVATVHLGMLQHRTRADRVAVLQDLAERELRPLLRADGETRDLAL